MEVPELLKNASESTATTLSHLVDDVKERIDDVKDRIDTGLLHRHAPPPKKHFPLRTVLALVGIALVAGMAIARRCADKASAKGERFARSVEDRAATSGEPRGTERVAGGADVNRVGRNYEEMAGTKVPGEGQIESASKN